MNPKYFTIQCLCMVYFFLVIFIGTTMASPTPTERSDYDNPCNKTSRCKTESWLSCDLETNKCVCARANEMIFDQSRGKCVALIGERCKFIFAEEERDYGIANPWYGIVECVQRGECGSSGICFCPSGTFENDNKCSPVKNYGDTCAISPECNKEKLLNCVGGVCQCDPNTAVYNTEFFKYKTPDYDYRTNVPIGICIGRVGTQCSYGTQKYCSQNSYCDEGNAANTCKCMPGFTETSQKLCGLGYGQKCSETNICSDNFRCSSERRNPVGHPTKPYEQTLSCECPHPKYQGFDWTNKICRGYVGTRCDSKDSFPCVESAICNCNTTDNTTRLGLCVCECQNGYVETVDGVCEVRHGFECTFINGEVPRSKSCDQMADLRCKNGKCGCEDDDDIYEHEKRKCSTSVGVRCENSTQCVQNADCRNWNGNVNMGYGQRCDCESGFNVTENHTCVLVREVELEITDSDAEIKE